MSSKPMEPDPTREVALDMEGNPIMIGGKVAYCDQFEGTSEAIEQANEKWFEDADLSKYGIDRKKHEQSK